MNCCIYDFPVSALKNLEQISYILVNIKMQLWKRCSPVAFLLYDNLLELG